MLSFIFVFLGLFVDIEITINCTQYAYSSPCSIPSSLILTVLCFFCLFSLLIYGFRIYFEMKRIEVSRNIIVKVCFRFPLDSFQMIIILFISSFTFFFRAIIEILFLFDVIELDFEFSFRFFSFTSQHFFEWQHASEWFASLRLVPLSPFFHHLYSTMYFFFFYFVTEITPLSILLLSTYIRTDSRKSKPRPDKRVVSTVYEPTSPRSSYNRHSVAQTPSMNSSGSRGDDVYTPVEVVSGCDVAAGVLIALAEHPAVLAYQEEEHVTSRVCAQTIELT